MMLAKSGRWVIATGCAFFLAVLIQAGHATKILPSPFPDTLTLEQALEMLDQNYPDVMAAQAAIDKAESNALSLDAVHAATVFAEVEARQADRHFPSDTHFIDDSRMRLVVNKPLTDFGLTETRRAGADLSLEAAQLNYQRVRRENRLIVIQSFLDVILSDYAYIVADEDMTLAFLRYDKELEKMERFGDANPIEVGAKEALYLDKLAIRADADNQRRRSRLRLALTLNRPDAYPDQMIEPRLSTYDRPVPDYDEILEQVLDNALEMDIARLNYTASTKRLQAATMVRPTLGLRFEATGYSESYAGSRDDLRASAFLKIPVYSGIKRDAEMVEAAAELERHRAELGSVEFELRIQVLKLVQGLKRNQVEINAAARELEYREHELDRIRLEYELDYRASIGEGNLNVAKALYRVMKVNYEKMLIWEQLDSLRTKTVFEASEPGT